MPDSRKHRGKHPSDDTIFDQKSVRILNEALIDLNYLVSRNYNLESSLSIVGNRYQLVQRQRLALTRNTASEASRIERKEKEIQIENCKGKQILIDGFNFLITMESAFSGGFIFEGPEGAYRDLSGIHGTYKRVTETLDSLFETGKFLEEKGIGEVIWYLDSPVSNSGRLKEIILQIAGEQNWNWQVLLVFNPDKELIQSKQIIVSSDSYILDHCTSWINLSKKILDEKKTPFNVIKFPVYLP